jgi:hypothetical protein
MRLLLCLISTAVYAGDLHVPTLTSDWSATSVTASQQWAVAPADVKATLPHAIEVAPGSFYLFRLHQDAKTKATLTRVYHSERANDFDLKARYPEAMHLVAEIDAPVHHVAKAGDQWTVHRDDGQSRSFTWQAITAPQPAAAGAGKVRVALYDDAGSAGKGVPACSAQLGALKDMEVTKLDGDGIRAGLTGYHVVIFTGGSGSRQASTIGLAGREQVRRFVEAGGGYVGICAGAYLACDGFAWSVHVLDAKTPSPLWERGHGDLDLECTASGQQVLRFPATSKVIYHNGPILTPAGNAAIPDYEPLAWFRSEVSKTPKHAGLQVNTPAIVRGACGKGKVIVSSPHPEQTAGLEQWVEQAVRAVAP